MKTDVRAVVDIAFHELLCQLDYPTNLSSHDVVVATLTLSEKKIIQEKRITQIPINNL